MKSLVTGGAGFIGSNLVETLLGIGHTVVCVDNESSDAHDKPHWNNDWKRVLSSDETKIEWFGHIHHQDGCQQKMNAYKENNLIPNVKYGCQIIDVLEIFCCKWVEGHHTISIA